MKVETLYAAVAAKVREPQDVVIFKTAMRNSLLKRVGDKKAAKGLDDIGRPPREVDFVLKYGKLRDAVFAAMVLDPRTMLHYKSGPERQYVRTRAIKFLKSLHKRFYGPGGTVEVDHPDYGSDSAGYDEESLESDDSTAARYDVEEHLEATPAPALEHAQPDWETLLRDAADEAYRVKMKYCKDENRKLPRGAPREARLVPKRVTLDMVPDLKDPLKFWIERKKNDNVKDLYEMAMATLCIPATEAASERVFKHTKRIRSATRTRLSADRAEALVVVGRALPALGYGSLKEFLRFWKGLGRVSPRS